MSVEGLSRTREQRKGGRGWRVATALTATALALAACSSSEKPGQGRPTAGVSATASPGAMSKAPATGPATRPAATPACRLENAGLQKSLRSNGNVVQLSSLMVGTSVDMAPHVTNGECYDQVTLRFKGSKVLPPQRPGVYASYIKPPVRENPSDQPVAVGGKAFLELNFGSWMYRQGGAEGPTQVSGAKTQNINEVRLTQNYEGYTTWVVGVDGATAAAAQRPFTLTEVSGTEKCPDLCVVLKIQAAQATS